MENNSRKEKAIPGDELAVIEEFEPGEGTYEVNGKIRASILGKINIDNKNKLITIETHVKKNDMPKPNDKVEGIIENIIGPGAILKIIKVNEEENFEFLKGVIEIRRSRGQRESGVDVTDHVRATVFSVIDGNIYLNIREQNDGVVSSKCIECCSRVVKVDRGTKCVQCGLTRFKKLALDFK